MEQSFQTSFIPKKPIVVERNVSRSSMGILTFFGIIVFLTMLVAYGAVFLYKSTLVKQLADRETNLNRARGRLEEVRIAELKQLDRRLRTATDVLNGHVVASPIFKALGGVTLKSVRYSNFSYGMADDTGKKIAVKLTGEAVGYRAVAMQADLFSQNKNIIDPVFSNLALDPKGHVIFDIDFTVEPAFVDYQENEKSMTLNN